MSIVPTHGYLSDHYNPQTRQLALSEAVYASNSLAAVGVACHEAGHAIQHATRYVPSACDPPWFPWLESVPAWATP